MLYDYDIIYAVSAAMNKYRLMGKRWDKRAAGDTAVLLIWPGKGQAFEEVADG